MRRLRSGAARRARRGVAAVEFAILLPFLVFALLVVVDFCRVFHYSITVSNCARNGALYGSADWKHATDAAGIRTAAKADAKSDLDLQQMDVAPAAYIDGSGAYVAVTVSYPFTTITQYPGSPRQTNLSRTVRMSVVPNTPTFN